MNRRTCIAAFLLLVAATALTAQEWAPFGPTGGYVETMAGDPATGDIYLAGNQEIYLLRRGERIWERRTFPSTSVYPVGQLIARNGELLAVQRGDRLHHSNDGGATWASVQLPIPVSDGTLSPVIPLRDTLYVYETYWNRLMWSVTNGRTWDLLDSTAWPDGIDRILDQVSFGGADTIIPPTLGELAEAIHTGDTIIALMIDWSLHRSYDAGATWESYPVKGSRGLVLHDDTLWVGLQDGISTMPIDGDSWSVRGILDHSAIGAEILFTAERTLVGGINGTYEWEGESGTFRRIDAGRYNHFIRQIVPAGDTLLVATQYGLYVTGDDGATWRFDDGPRGAGSQRMRWDQGRIYALDGQSLYRSDDGGRSWSSILPDAGAPPYPSALYADRGTLFVGGENGIIRTADGGEVWESLSMATTGRVLGIAGAGDTLIARVLRDRALHRSTDFGASWETVPLPPGSAAHDMLAYADRVLFIGSHDSGLARSTDLGMTWTRTKTFVSRSEPLDTSHVRIVTLDVYGDTLFARVEYDRESIMPDHLYMSVDGGSSWRELTSPDSEPLAIVPWRGRLLAATARASVQATQLTLDVADRRDAIAITFDEEADLIYWSTTTPTSYSIDLYTLTGEHVLNVKSGDAEAGEHVAELPEMAGGVYLCVVRTEETTAGVVVAGE